MAYFSSNSSELSGFGCGPGCACKSCASNLAEVYEEEKPAPPAPPPKARPASPKIGAWFGEPPLLQPHASLMPGQLRMPAFETLTGYAPGGWRLNQAQLAQIQRLAAHVIRTWTTTTPVTGIRLIGFAEAGEPQAALQRTDAARAAINAAVSQLNPRILRGIQFSSEDGGSAPGAGGIVRRVEILLWVGLGVPFTPPVQPTPWRVPRIPVGPPVQIPTPAEAARRVFRPETPEERLNRMLRTLPPAPPPRRSLDQRFWRTVDERLNSAMNRAGVPQRLRGPLRDAARAAISRGAEAIFDQALDAIELRGEPREAVKSVVRAAIQVPIP
ncbi:MAG TPA: hypothetical protein VEQ38_07835 [Verrucomicrobiae bacterium]|nr:hypothetical protein [Verrucomicrobiae bacterium]